MDSKKLNYKTLIMILNPKMSKQKLLNMNKQKYKTIIQLKLNSLKLINSKDNHIKLTLTLFSKKNESIFKLINKKNW